MSFVFIVIKALHRLLGDSLCCIYSRIPYKHPKLCGTETRNNQNDAKTEARISLSFISASHQFRYFQKLVTIVYDISGLRINQSKASSPHH